MSTCNRLDLQTVGFSTGYYAQKSPQSLPKKPSPVHGKRGLLASDTTIIGEGGCGELDLDCPIYINEIRSVQGD